MIVFTDKGDGYFWAYSPSDNRQQICFKVRQLFNYNCDKYDSQSVMVCYYKVRQLFVLKIVKICYAVRPFITKYDDYWKVPQNTPCSDKGRALSVSVVYLS